MLGRSRRGRIDVDDDAGVLLGARASRRGTLAARQEGLTRCLRLVVIGAEGLQVAHAVIVRIVAVVDVARMTRAASPGRKALLALPTSSPHDGLDDRGPVVWQLSATIRR
jgi:hypothetical protein